MSRTRNTSSSEDSQPDCDKCKEYKSKVKSLEKEMQEIKLLYTKYELLLQNYGLIEKASEISDSEAICIEQLKRLKDKSSINAFSETDAKILDLLQKNLRISRGEKIEGDKKGKTKSLSNAELLTLIKTEEKE